MKFCRMLSGVVLCLASATLAQAQGLPDATGHWEATVQVQGIELPVEVDLGRTSTGQLIGTFGQPAQKLKGLPLANIAVDGARIGFVFAVSGSRFQGTLADRTTMSGDLSSDSFGTVAMTLRRTGDARFEPPPTSTAITKQVEGTWTGTLEVDGGLRLKLTMANQSDGTSRGTLVSIDQRGLEIPVKITQEGPRVLLELRMVGGSYSGSINPSGELVGVFSTSEGLELPLTFRRDDKTPTR